jgi:hypothetical protein
MSCRLATHSARGQVIMNLRWLSWPAIGLSSLPALTLAAMMTLALHVRILLGHWPVVYRDSPDGALLGLHIRAAGYLLWSSMITAPFWLLSLIAAVLTKQRRTALTMVLLFLIPSLIFGSWFWFDPGGFIEWFLD